VSDIAITTDGVYFQSMLYVPDTTCSPEGNVDCTSDFWQGRCVNGVWKSIYSNYTGCGYKPGTEVTTETLVLPSGDVIQVDVPVGQEPPTLEEFLAGNPDLKTGGGGVPIIPMVAMIGVLGVAMIAMKR